MFSFKGNLEYSKSWLNRMQIIRAFTNEWQLLNLSESEDVQSLAEALKKFKQASSKAVTTENFYLGHGGTSFRFFSFFISRQPGIWNLKATTDLMNRPQSKILEVLTQFGVKAELKTDGLLVESQGWSDPNTEVCFSGTDSTQFISGLLLASWQLPFELKLKIAKPILSRDYLQMTTDLLNGAGMRIITSESSSDLTLVVARNQNVIEKNVKPEIDVSSAFSLAAAAVVNGNVEILNWDPKNTQPDGVFLKLFEKMGIAFTESTSSLKISKQFEWKSIEYDLGGAPDLFPVLSTLCAMAKGRSRLYGAKQLRDKESDRIKLTQSLLSLCHVKTEILEDGLIIFGEPEKFSRSFKKEIPETASNNELVFDPSNDHRMAMAAGILKLAGAPIQISNRSVVNKSYPQFWQHVGLE